MRALRHRARRSGAARLVGAAALIASCGPGEVTLEVVLPASVGRELAAASYFRLVARPESGPDRTTLEGELAGLSLPDLEDGSWTLEVTAFDSREAVLLVGRTEKVAVARGRRHEVALVLAPPESLVTVPTRGEDVEAIAARFDPSATTIEVGGHSYVLVAGGSVGGLPRREAWLYSHARVSFARVGDMVCPRAGHAAVAVSSAGGPGVLVAGGGRAGCPEGEARDAAGTLELFGLEDRSFEALDVGLSEDLSTAVLAAYDSRTVFLAAGGQAWQIDLGSNRAASLSVSTATSGALAVPLSESAVALVGGPSKSLAVFGESGSCEFRSVELPESDHSAVGLGLGRVLVTHGEAFWILDVPGCTALAATTLGTLAPSRSEHTATVLTDGRVLLVGGTAETTTFPPVTMRDAPFHPGPSSLRAGRGHRGAALSGGRALLVGGGHPPELFTPADHPVPRGSFAAGARPEPEDGFWIVFVVDGTASGERLRALLGENASKMTTLRGVDLDGTRIGVLPSYAGAGPFSGARGCEPGRVLPAWTTCEGEGSSAALLSPAADAGAARKLECRLGAASAGPDRDAPCPVAQPLAVLAELVEQLAAGGPALGAIEPSFGAVLVVLVTHGEDCSLDPEVASESVPYEGSCAGRPLLLEPARVASMLRPSAGSELRVEVAVLHAGAFDPLGECVAPDRLRELAEAAPDAVVLVPFCNESLESTAAARVNEMARRLVNRSVCVDRRRAGGQPRCSLYLVRSTGSASERVELLDPGVHWTDQPEAPRCDGRLELRLLPGHPPIPYLAEESFARFQYVCW